MLSRCADGDPVAPVWALASIATCTTGSDRREYMGGRTDSRPKFHVPIGQYVFIARNWSWSETGVLKALGLSTSDRNCPEQTHFELCILWTCRSMSSVDYAGGQGVAGSNPVVPTVYVQVGPCLLWRDRACLFVRYSRTVVLLPGPPCRGGRRRWSSVTMRHIC